jgi:hypothetical protein
MAKKASKADTALAVLAIVVGVPVFLVSKLIDSVGWVLPVVVIAVIIGLFVWRHNEKKKKRLEYLRAKYNSEEVVQKIVEGCIWQGQDEEQLKDAIGDPVTIDQVVLKTKTKEVWKYQQSGANRFGLRVTVENGHVVGWDKKS